MRNPLTRPSKPVEGHSRALVIPAPRSPQYPR
jgi:hypothetical protein